MKRRLAYGGTHVPVAFHCDQSGRHDRTRSAVHGNRLYGSARTPLGSPVLRVYEMATLKGGIDGSDD